MLIKPPHLHKGDQVAIVSLSAGTLGEDFASHQRKLGVHRLQQLGLQPVFMPNALKGIDYLKQHPQARAQDLKAAFANPEIKGIFAAIGGIDTYRLMPYLMDDADFVQNVQQHPKLFSGFSDTTVDHLMFYRLGMQSFYGPSFLNDLAELGPDLLPYTKKTLAHYFTNPPETTIAASPIWYEERTDFSPQQVGIPRKELKDQDGYLVLRGSGQITGRLLGGCLESLTDLLGNSSFPEEKAINEQYHLFPKTKNWSQKILFIETSEDQPTPTQYQELLSQLEKTGIFEVIKGIIVGKPQNKKYYSEYQQVLLQVTEAYQTPILYNCNFGHAYPRTALPYGCQAQIDFDNRTLKIVEPWFS